MPRLSAVGILGIHAGEDVNNGAAHVHLASNATTIQPYSATIYSGTAVGNNPTASLEDYSDHTFTILGVDADDDVTIQAAPNGTDYQEMAVVNINTNAFVAAGTPIEVPGIYKFGPAAGIFTSDFVTDAVRVSRITAVGANAVSVHMTAKVAR